ncbi:MAG: arsenosugar biosynthesis radical SAM protein ArsS [bacterium]|jgi:radical SAM/Cys-rich protein|nr:arsenosugar biosynthesis radical SAM protein ArsS [bacterium]
MEVLGQVENVYPGGNEFEEHIAALGCSGLYARDLDIVQVNLGYRCNLTCKHCHLNCSPQRPEMMSWNTMEDVIEACSDLDNCLVDITGGSPELNPHFVRFVSSLCDHRLQVKVRTNLSVLFEPGMEPLAKFYRDRKVRLVASVPCYLEENVRAQRGAGVYEKIIDAIRLLNGFGYGIDPQFPLDLVYNPSGPFLPPLQEMLESDYRRELADRHDVAFTRLHTITNMPLGRFGIDLHSSSREGEYWNLLLDSFNDQTLENLMCRQQVSVGWDGTLYDCDFNLALGYPVESGVPDQIRYFDKTVLSTRRIVTGKHCFGCTAGAGSSCGGALV